MEDFLFSGVNLFLLAYLLISSLKNVVTFCFYYFQSEYQILQEREHELKKREIRLSQDEDRLIKLNKLDSKLRFEEIKMRYENEINNLRNDLKEKAKENKRLNEAYKIIKKSNENLKSQVILKNHENANKYFQRFSSWKFV